MKVRIKKLHSNAVIPTYANPGDAGMDLTAISCEWIDNSNSGKPSYLRCKTGLAMEIPEGYVGLLFSRSSVTHKTSLILGNCVGVIDSTYRGEIEFRFKDIGFEGEYHHYTNGDRVGQIIILPYPQIEFEEIDELSDSDRGKGGFGSTGS